MYHEPSSEAPVPFKAITFDFYNTLAYHRRGIGRGKLYQNYLSTVGLNSDPWQHQVLDVVFDYYGSCYSPTFSDEARLSFWTEFTRRLFERTNVRGSGTIDFSEHAHAIQEIMGPNCFALFDDSFRTLRTLRMGGFRLAVISDWQSGLVHFCEELGIGRFVDSVVTSREAGCQKPDPRLFHVACKEMGIAPEDILHVGDLGVDIEGAHAAGFSALRLLRSEESVPEGAFVIRDLGAVLAHVALDPTRNS